MCGAIVTTKWKPKEYAKGDYAIIEYYVRVCFVIDARSPETLETTMRALILLMLLLVVVFATIGTSTDPKTKCQQFIDAMPERLSGEGLRAATPAQRTAHQQRVNDLLRMCVGDPDDFFAKMRSR
jgi:hypothetical protein